MNDKELRFYQQETTRYLINRALTDIESLSEQERDIVTRARNGEQLETIYEDVPLDFFNLYMDVLQRSMAIFLSGQEMPHYITGQYQFA